MKTPTRTIVPLSVLLFALVACAPDDGSPTSTIDTDPPETTSTTEPAEVGDTAPVVTEVPPCLDPNLDYAGDGAAGVFTTPASDSVAVNSARWESFEGCDLLTIGFSTSTGAPAVDPPTVTGLVIRSSGIIRLNLGGEVSGSTIRDQLVDSELVDRIYVVRTASDSMFVDIHLKQPAVVNLQTGSRPATATLAIRTGGPAEFGRAVSNGDTVIIEPIGGLVSYPFSLTGYRATGEEVTTSGSVEVTAPVGDTGDAWGAFTLLIADGPQGPISVAIDDLAVSLTTR